MLYVIFETTLFRNINLIKAGENCLINAILHGVIQRRRCLVENNHLVVT